MIQQEMLQYQTLDMELLRIERNLKKSDAFLKRKDLKVALQKSEEQLARLDQKTLELRNQLVQAGQTLQKINDVIDEHTKEISDIEDQDELNYMNKKLDEQLGLLASVEKEIRQILKDAEDVAKTFEHISKVQAPRLVAEYNKYNAEFERATQEVKPKVMEIKRKQMELKNSIDEQLFERYKKLSEQMHPVFVPLENGNCCGGCRMEMPHAVIDPQMEKSGFARCEHCGRIIYKS